jgi:predicted outer membrane protein
VAAAALLIALIPCAAWADKIDDSSRQLRSSRDYKVRLSAALFLAKQRGDERAVKALARALMDDGETTVRRVAALSLGTLVGEELPSTANRMALKALEHAADRDRDGRVRSSAGSALIRARRQMASASSSSSTASSGRGRIFVHVGKANDLSRKLPSGSIEMVQAAVRGSLRRHAPDYQMSSGSPPTRSELASRRMRGYYVGAQVAKVAISARGNQTEVSCTVSMRVSPWSGRDGNERLAANESATASGSGRVSSSARDTTRAAADCAVAVTEELTVRQVVPFLRRVGN